MTRSWSLHGRFNEGHRRRREAEAFDRSADGGGGRTLDLVLQTDVGERLTAFDYVLSFGGTEFDEKHLGHRIRSPTTLLRAKRRQRDGNVAVAVKQPVQEVVSLGLHVHGGKRWKPAGGLHDGVDELEAR